MGGGEVVARELPVLSCDPEVRLNRAGRDHEAVGEGIGGGSATPMRVLVQQGGMSGSHEFGVKHPFGSRTPRRGPCGTQERNEVLSGDGRIVRHERRNDVLAQSLDEPEQPELPAHGPHGVLIQGWGHILRLPRPQPRTPQLRIPWVRLPDETRQLVDPARNDLLDKLACRHMPLV